MLKPHAKNSRCRFWSSLKDMQHECTTFDCLQRLQRQIPGVASLFWSQHQQQHQNQHREQQLLLQLQHRQLEQQQALCMQLPVSISCMHKPNHSVALLVRCLSRALGKQQIFSKRLQKCLRTAKDSIHKPFLDLTTTSDQAGKFSRCRKTLLTLYTPGDQSDQN